jgi:hypothetical protein
MDIVLTLAHICQSGSPEEGGMFKVAKLAGFEYIEEFHNRERFRNTLGDL